MAHLYTQVSSKFTKLFRGIANRHCSELPRWGGGVTGPLRFVLFSGDQVSTNAFNLFERVIPLFRYEVEVLLKFFDGLGIELVYAFATGSDAVHNSDAF